MVVIAGDITRVAVPDRARLATKHVPNRQPAIILVGGALDLIRSGRYAPDEVFRKTHTKSPFTKLRMRREGAPHFREAVRRTFPPARFRWGAIREIPARSFLQNR